MQTIIYTEFIISTTAPNFLKTLITGSGYSKT